MKQNQQSPAQFIITPRSQLICLTQRSNNTISTVKSRKEIRTERKIVSIDLKNIRKQSVTKNKKIVIMKKKLQNPDTYSLKNNKAKLNDQSISSPNKKLGKKTVIALTKQKIRPLPFGESDYYGGDFQFSENKTQKEMNWQEIIQKKKNQLYSQLYKMDKKIFSIERDLDHNIKDIENKKKIMELVKKKISSASHKEVIINPSASKEYTIGKNKMQVDIY